MDEGSEVAKHFNRIKPFLSSTSEITSQQQAPPLRPGASNGAGYFPWRALRCTERQKEKETALAEAGSPKDREDDNCRCHLAQDGPGVQDGPSDHQLLDQGAENTSVLRQVTAEGGMTMVTSTSQEGQQRRPPMWSRDYEMS